ncbi:MAG: hypothetical protein NTX91_01340 [candidate division SR1 bacterium]|nr:hypothetical protein [candidate division SR1 bacterium]
MEEQTTFPEGQKGVQNTVNVGNISLSDEQRKILVNQRSELQATLFETHEHTDQDKIAMAEIKRITLELGEPRYLS